MRVAACARPKFQIMLKRIQAGACDIRVLFEIPCAIEKRMRTAPVMATPFHVMFQRVKSCDFGILREVPSCAEKRMRIATVARPKFQIMLERIDVGAESGVLLQIP